MKKFFNLIPSPDNCCILLYGDIGEYDVKSADIAGELMEAAIAYKNIDIRINSMGGEVYAGIAIFNAIRQSTANITIYVDGIAASIASVIALCGKPMKMSKYARLMLHDVQGGCWGNKDTIRQTMEEVIALENTLCQMYSQKCNMTEDEIRTRFFDGKDHWLSADEALQLGFCDEIFDADPVPTDSTVEQIYTTFINRLEKAQNKTEMNLEELRKRPRFANAATDDEVLRLIDGLEQEAGKVPGLNTELTTVKASLLVFENKAKVEEEAAIAGLVDAAVNDGRIQEPQRVTFTNLLKGDRVNGEAALAALKPSKRIMTNLGTQDAPGAWDKKMEEIKNNQKK